MDTNDNSANMPSNVPYRATKLWNEIIRVMKSELPLRRHRRHMKQYENCFSACDAADWLHAYLCRSPNFGADVTRQQTIQLLRKLYQSGIFEEARVTNQNGTGEFKDNHELYRFSHMSPTKTQTQSSPLRDVLNVRTSTLPRAGSSSKLRSCTDKKLTFADEEENDPTPEFRQFRRRLTVSETENTWKISTLERLRAVMGLQKLDDILSEDFVNPKHVIHNMNKVLSNGMVAPLDKSKELPYWILNAMKCLSVWPTATGGGSCLPNYPGFEQDVFIVVKDYFQNLDEPLTTFDLYHLLVSIVVRGEYLDSECHQQFTSDPVHFEEQNDEELLMTESVEDLMQRMASVFAGEGSLRKSRRSLVSSCPDLLDDADARRRCGRNGIVTLSDRASSADPDSGSTCCFETAFDEASPVTRVVPRDAWLDESATYNRGRRQYGAAFAVGARPGCRDVDVVQWRVVRSGAVAPPIYENVHQEADADWTIGRYRRPYSAIGMRSPPYFDSSANCSCGGCSTIGTASSSLSLLDAASVSSVASFHTARSRNSVVVERQAVVPGSSGRSSVVSATLPTRERRSEAGLSSSESRCGVNLMEQRRYDSIPGKTMTVAALQLSLLMLSPDSRRRLHQLLRFMSRVADNRQLILQSGQTNRQLVLHVFSKCLVSARHEADYDEVVSQRLATFLMDHYDAILTVPHTLHCEVQERLLSISRTKIKYSVDDGDVSPITYCEQVTVAQYEQQKVDLAHRAIADLLDSLVADTQLPSRIRKKKLKQFKKMYPEIYASRFPTTVKKSTPLFGNHLQRFRALRM